MQILKINSVGSLSSFKSQKASDEAVEKDAIRSVVEFADYSDSELMNIASYQPNQEYKKTARELLKTMFLAVPAIDIAVSGLSRRGDLSGKMLSAGKQTGRWAGILATGAVILGAKRIVNNNIPELKEMDKDHPVLAFCLDFAALFGGYSLLIGAKNAAKKFTKTNFVEGLETINKQVKAPLKKALNASYLNKEIILPMEERLFKSANGWGRSLALVGALLAPTVAVAAILKSISEVKSKSTQIDDNYSFLKETQNIVREQLDERDINS